MKILFTAALMITMSTLTFAQKEKPYASKERASFGLGVERQTTGSGHLNFTTMGASVNYGKSSLYLGALLEDRNRSFKGLKANYRLFPLSFGSGIHPYFQYQFLSRWNARLVPELERIMHSDNKLSGDPMERYRTMEHYLGFGFQGDLFEGAFFDLGIGLGAYHSELTSGFDHRTDAERFRSSFDASLSLNAGVGYRF